MGKQELIDELEQFPEPRMNVALETAVASESALCKDWQKTDEDAAWQLL